MQEFRVPNDGLIQLIILNETSSMNALSQKMVAELSEEVEMIHEEKLSGPSRAVVFASAADKAFCAGANLKERAGMTLDQYVIFQSLHKYLTLFREWLQETRKQNKLTAHHRANFFLQNLRHTFARIAALPIPTISAINGFALGGGLELALCTYLRVMSSTAVVGLPEVGLGIVPGTGGTYRLPRLIGHSRALDMMLTARRVGAKEALELGLCNVMAEYERVGDPFTDPKMEREMVLRKALHIAALASLQAPLAVKALLRATSEGGGEREENEAYESVIRTKDRDEALAAFREKRMPVFRGE